MNKKLNLFKTKKGIVADTTIFAVSMFVIAIFLVITFVVFSKIDDAIKAQPETIPPEQAAILSDYIDDYVTIWDMSFLIMFFGLILAGIIFSFLVDATALFFFFMWFGSMVLLVVSAALGNAYGDFSLSPSIASFANQFVFIPFIFSHYLEIMIVVTALYIIAFSTKGSRVI